MLFEKKKAPTPGTHALVSCNGPNSTFNSKIEGPKYNYLRIYGVCGRTMFLKFFFYRKQPLTGVQANINFNKTHR